VFAYEIEGIWINPGFVRQLVNGTGLKGDDLIRLIKKHEGIRSTVQY